jgi:dienelactone hydrolase
MKKFFIVLGAVILAAILFGVIYVATGIDFPPLKGQYKVGKTLLDVVDQSRQEIFSNNPADKREILLTIYYPANPKADAKPSPYVSGTLAEVMAKKTGVPKFILDTFHAQAYDEAPVAQIKSPFPVLLFSQGLNGQLPPYSSLLEEVASHGYIIVCISHQYSDTFVVYPDGRAVYVTPTGMFHNRDYSEYAAHEEEALQVLKVWSNDTIFALNQLEKINKSHKILANSLDLTNIGIFGHSFGGSTATEVMLRDSRIKAGIDLDGSLYRDVKAKGVQQPFFMMTSQGLGPFWFAMSGNVQKVLETSQLCYLMGIRNTGHISFVTDVPFIVKKYGLLIHQDVGTIDPSENYAIITDYVVQFFDQELKGIHSSLLDQINPSNTDAVIKKQKYPEVTIQKYSKGISQDEAASH